MVGAMPVWCASCKVCSNGADQEGNGDAIILDSLPWWSLTHTTVERLQAPLPCLTGAESWLARQCLLTCKTFKRQYQPHQRSTTHSCTLHQASPWLQGHKEGGRARRRTPDELRRTSTRKTLSTSVPESRDLRMSLPETNFLRVAIKAFLAR